MRPKTIDNLLSHSSESLLGQIQIDAVEHCGQTTAGEYTNTISNTDISSHWWKADVAAPPAPKTQTLSSSLILRSFFSIA